MSASQNVEEVKQPAWGPRSDRQRLDWLLQNCQVAGLSGDLVIDREAIDDAIAREEFRGSK